QHAQTQRIPQWITFIIEKTTCVGVTRLERRQRSRIEVTMVSKNDPSKERKKQRKKQTKKKERNKERVKQTSKRERKNEENASEERKRASRERTSVSVAPCILYQSRFFEPLRDSFLLLFSFLFFVSSVDRGGKDVSK